MLNLPDCSYSERARRKRKRSQASEKFAALENRLKEMESAMKSSGAPYFKGESLLKTPPSHFIAETSVSEVHAPSEHNKQSSSENTLEYATTQQAIDQGETGYRGYSAESAFMQHMKEKLGAWPGVNINHRVGCRDKVAPSLFEPDKKLANQASLPPKKRALELIEAALDSHELLQVVHRPSFDESVHVLYSLSPQEYSIEEMRHLPLVYALMALGCLFTEPNVSDTSRLSVPSERQVSH
jgi:hypothetical protein